MTITDNTYLLIIGILILAIFLLKIKSGGLAKKNKKELNSLEFENKNLKEVLDSKEIAEKELTKKLADSNNELYYAKNEIEKFDDQLKELTINLTEAAEGKKNIENLYFNLNIELSGLKEKFLPLEHRVNDIKRFEKEIENLQSELENLIARKKSIIESYAAKKEIYDELNREITILEDRLEMYSFGLYEPHFNYDSSEKYKEQMNISYQERISLVKNDEAVKCYTEWTINGDKAAGKRQTRQYTKMMLRAFNGECDAAIAKVKWNNMQTMELRVLVSFNAINKLGESHNILIKQEYRDIRVKELRLAYEYQEKVHEEREEQRRIREQIREEERALREMEVARVEAEKEEERYLKALSKAKIDLDSKHGLEKNELLSKISQLEEDLRKIQELKERAISMAQITKSGYVYVISNIGSFGEDVYKIGMTRRLEPTDRVRELSGASVPFAFDIHAMIYSKNAPELENNFHKKFKANRVNWVNGRKEFFQVSLEDIERVAHELEHKIEFTKLAEARDYRETRVLLERYQKTGVIAEIDEKFPNQLDEEDPEDEDVDENFVSNSD